MQPNKADPRVFSWARHTLTAADTEIPIFVTQNNKAHITRASMLFDAAVASTTSNGLLFYLINEGTAYTLNTTIASYSLSTLAATTLTAGYKYEMTLSSTEADTIVDPDEVMSFYQKTLGSGVVSGGIHVVVEYVLL